MRMRSAHGTISDIKMVVHQQYEWIIEREVHGRDNWRRQVPRPYEPRGKFRNVTNAANTTLVQHSCLHQETLNTVCSCTIRGRASTQHPACLLSTASASCDTSIPKQLYCG